jgi:hypothetical protein
MTYRYIIHCEMIEKKEKQENRTSSQSTFRCGGRLGAEKENEKEKHGDHSPHSLHSDLGGVRWLGGEKDV